MEEVKLLSYLRIRQVIGWLGIMLSFSMWFGNLIISKTTTLQPSISDYYYTCMGDVFVGILFAIAMFLFSYKGFDENDNKITSLAGTFAIIVALFPTGSTNVKYISNTHTILNIPYSALGYIHLTAAGLFFITLSAYSYFWFTKGNLNNPMKVYRNKVYKTCAVIMVFSIISILIMRLLKISFPNSTYWFETLALLAFGISWLVKGETISILKDK